LAGRYPGDYCGPSVTLGLAPGGVIPRSQLPYVPSAT